jgi:hypothetical protein
MDSSQRFCKLRLTVGQSPNATGHSSQRFLRHDLFLSMCPRETIISVAFCFQLPKSGAPIMMPSSMLVRLRPLQMTALLGGGRGRERDSCRGVPA